MDRQTATPTTSNTMTIAATAQGVEMLLSIGSSPRVRLLVGQAVLGDELPDIRSGRHLAIAAHLAGDGQVVRIRMIVDLPVVLGDRIKSRQPLLALGVAVVEDEVCLLPGLMDHDTGALVLKPLLSMDVRRRPGILGDADRFRRPR